MASEDRKKPALWGNPDRQGFLNWAYNALNYNGAAAQGAEGALAVHQMRGLFPHQKFVRDFMQFESPYRGILLLHGLGTGKTASSIAAAEGFVKNNKKIVVMLPASLETNYRDEIMRHASFAGPHRKVWNLLDTKKLTKEVVAALDVTPAFAKKNPRMWFPFVATLLPQIPTTAILRSKVEWTDLEPSEKEAATETLRQIIDKKYTFIRYNGLTQSGVAKYGKDFFDDSFVVIDEVHNFVSRVMNGGKTARNLYNKIMNASNVKIVALSGTPIINQPFELSIALNILRGYMTMYELAFLKNSGIPSLEELDELLDDAGCKKYIDQRFIDEQNRKLQITILPPGYVDDGDGMMVAAAAAAGATAPTAAEIIGKIQAALAAYSKKYSVSKKTSVREMFALPTNKEAFDAIFLDERDRDNPRVKNMNLFMRRIIGVVSYNRSLGENLLPTVLPRIIERIPLTDYQFNKYLMARQDERKMEMRSKMNGGVLSKKTSVYRAFSRMACNFVFPEHIKRPFPKDLRRELRSEIDRIEEDDVEDESDSDSASGSGKGAAAAGPAKIDNNKVKKDYEQVVKKALKQLADTPELLSVDNLASLYSPKFAQIIRRVDESPGKCLVYSQFRTIEGIGVLTLALEAAGHVEVKVERKSDGSGKWSIVNADTVMAPEYDGKRFVVFDPDREKATILLQLYNGIYTNVDVADFGDLEPAANLRGEMFKTIMITQSGAEGISLKNVRTVLITEPFWNMIRLEQVIGRAVRAGSHLDLPAAERNVQVYIYTCTFTAKQLKENFTLRSLDNEMTSDTHILRIAEKKDEVIQEFLNNMKAAAVDCRNNSKTNQLFSAGIQCYSFPIPIDDNEYAFVPDIADDIERRPSQKLDRARKIRGRVVTRRNKKYVIVDEYPNKFFDYSLYKDAGVLHEIKAFAN